MLHYRCITNNVNVYCVYSVLYNNITMLLLVCSVYIVFNRRSLDPERVDKMLICRDYWVSHAVKESFQLCEVCSQGAAPSCYKIHCAKHNSK